MSVRLMSAQRYSLRKYSIVLSGSVLFDGTGDYLTVPSNAAFAFGTGDFTVEAWFKTSQTTRIEIASRYNGDNAGSWGLAANIGAVRDIIFYIGNTAIASSAGGIWNSGSWNHVAVSRISGTLRLFCNGTTLTTVSNSTNITDNGSSLAISQAPTLSGGLLNGRLSDLRIVKGTAIYTANYTIPASPLIAVTNTVLLTANSASVIADGSVNSFTVTAVGDAVANTDYPFA